VRRCWRRIVPISARRAAARSRVIRGIGAHHGWGDHREPAGHPRRKAERFDSIARVGPCPSFRAPERWRHRRPRCSAPSTGWGSPRLRAINDAVFTPYAAPANPPASWDRQPRGRPCFPQISTVWCRVARRRCSRHRARRYVMQPRRSKRETLTQRQAPGLAQPLQTGCPTAVLGAMDERGATRWIDVPAHRTRVAALSWAGMERPGHGPWPVDCMGRATHRMGRCTQCTGRVSADVSTGPITRCQ